MCQNLNSCESNLLYEARYKILCKLYSRYNAAIKVALENVNEKQISDKKMNELDLILQDIEKYPIPWSYYKSQTKRFTTDFENLIIFKTM